MHPTANLPFKIGALTLPMLTHNGSYRNSLDALGSLLTTHYRGKFFPIVSCGESCDALGYGHDVLEACRQVGCQKVCSQLARVLQEGGRVQG